MDSLKKKYLDYMRLENCKVIYELENDSTIEFLYRGIALDEKTGNRYIETFFHEATNKYLAGQTIMKKIYQNNGIRNKLEAWLIFLSDDNPETIVRLMEEYPKFREMYEDVYELCLNTEKVMNMFSKELQELDRNTVQYMIDEMQDEIDSQKIQLREKDEQLQNKDAYIAELEAEIAKRKSEA